MLPEDDPTQDGGRDVADGPAGAADSPHPSVGPDDVEARVDAVLTDLGLTRTEVGEQGVDALRQRLADAEHVLRLARRHGGDE